MQIKLASIMVENQDNALHFGVRFRGEPKRMGPITAVLFEDTCGNLINLVQPPA